MSNNDNVSLPNVGENNSKASGIVDGSTIGQNIGSDKGSVQNNSTEKLGKSIFLQFLFY
jgi:hypothetical protein